MKCHRNGCHSSADYHVGLEVACFGKGKHRQMLQSPTTIKVCREHMTAAAQYILSPANKAQISAGVFSKGIPLPEWSTAEIVFVPIRAAVNNLMAAQVSGKAREASTRRMN
jgi:hypothetical protein